jgi:hypothetical protein
MVKKYCELLLKTFEHGPSTVIITVEFVVVLGLFVVEVEARDVHLNQKKVQLLQLGLEQAELVQVPGLQAILEVQVHEQQQQLHEVQCLVELLVEHLVE